jgi:hypothetical protein
MAELVIETLRELSTGKYRLVVILDDTVPHPQRYYALLEAVPTSWTGTEDEWLDAERDRIRPFAQAALDDINATSGSALPGEGDPL